jgi:hypothetical protein
MKICLSAEIAKTSHVAWVYVGQTARKNPEYNTTPIVNWHDYPKKRAGKTTGSK